MTVLAVLACLAPETRAGFHYLVLDLTDGSPGAHLHRLEESGSITVAKTFVSKKPQTSIEATQTGKRALREHVAALGEIQKTSGRLVAVDDISFEVGAGEVSCSACLPAAGRGWLRP